MRLSINSIIAALFSLALVPAYAADILILEDTLSPSPPNKDEKQIAEERGHNVTVADSATWAGYSAGEFAAFDAIIFAEHACGSGDTSDLDPAAANKGTWSPQVTGNIFLHTFDAAYHGEGQYEELIANAINFVASGNGTGLFYGNGCRNFDGPLAFLDGVVAVTIIDGSDPDIISIVAPDHPTMAGLTNEGLSGWGNSTHAVFDTSLVLETIAISDESGEDQGFAVALASGGIAATPVPTLSDAMRMIMVALLLMGAMIFLRKRRAAV